MTRLLLATLAILLCVAPVAAQQSRLRDAAQAAAIATFEKALPHLSATEFGVDVAAYRDALTLGRFNSSLWGGAIEVDLVTRGTATGSCSRFAAFVRLPPEHNIVQLVLCPQFFSANADALRQLTLLHEMVHIVAGRNECQAMAFAARLEQLGRGHFTPVDAYWAASACAASKYRLP